MNSSTILLIDKECTYAHFQTNSNCPMCNRILGEEDFREMTISKPPNRDQEKQAVFKRIFVKSSSRCKELSSKDVWDRILRQSKIYRDSMKFTLRQFLKENVSQVRRSIQIQHTLRVMKQEQTNLKQEINRQKEKIGRAHV